MTDEEKKKKTIWQQIADRLNSFLLKPTILDELEATKAAIALDKADSETIERMTKDKAPKIPKADLYDEQDVKNMYSNFIKDVDQKYTADTGMAVMADLQITPQTLTEIFSNLFEYNLDSEGKPIQNQERNVLSDEYKNLSLYEKIAWDRIKEIEEFTQRFPTHATRGRQYEEIIERLERENKISKELADVLLLDTEPTDEMAKIAEEYQAEFFNNFSDINREILDQAGDFSSATRKFIEKISLKDIVAGETVLPIAKSQAQLLLEQTNRNLINRLTDETITQAQFNSMVDNIFTTNAFQLPDKKSKAADDVAFAQIVDRYKEALWNERNRLLFAENLDDVTTGQELLRVTKDFMVTGNIDNLIKMQMESTFQNESLNEKDAKKILDDILFKLGLNKSNLLTEDYTNSHLQVRNFTNTGDFSEWLGKTLPLFLTKKQNSDILSKPDLFKNELINIINPKTDSYRRYLEETVLNDKLVKYFYDIISRDLDTRMEETIKAEITAFDNDPVIAGIGRLFTGLNPSDFDEQKVIERIGTLQQQINLGYDPATNTWDTRAGLLPKSPLSALEVGPDVTEDELLQAYDELAGGDERFFRYLSAISPQLKSQFSNEWRSLRGDPGFTPEERRIQQAIDQGHMKIEDVNPGLYKSIQDKISGTYGQVASKLFSDISTGTQTDSASARRLIEAVGIPTPDPVKILGQLETEGVALTEGQRKVLLESGTPGVTVTEGALQAENLAAYATKPSLTFTDYLKGRRSDLQKEYSLTTGQTPRRQMAGTGTGRAFTTRFTRGRT